MSSVSVDYCDTNLGKVTFSTLLPQRLTIILGIKMFKNVNNILYVCYTAQRNTRFQKWSKSWHEVATGGRQSAKAFFFFFYWRKWNGPRVNKEWIKTCVFFIVRPSSSSSSSFLLLLQILLFLDLDSEQDKIQRLISDSWTQVRLKTHHFCPWCLCFHDNILRFVCCGTKQTTGCEKTSCFYNKKRWCFQAQKKNNPNVEQTPSALLTPQKYYSIWFWLCCSRIRWRCFPSPLPSRNRGK